MKSLTSLMLSVCALFIGSARELAVDTEGRPVPYVVSRFEFGKSFYFKMSPDPKYPKDRTKGLGFAYSVEIGEPDVLIWKTDGWYAADVYLTCEGTRLVRIGDWPRGDKPKPEDLAIAFYSKGQLVKSYSTLDLIKDSSKVKSSASHYIFCQEDSSRFVPMTAEQHREEFFEMVTIDRVRYVFRIDDGSIVSSTQND